MKKQKAYTVNISNGDGMEMVVATVQTPEIGIRYIEMELGIDCICPEELDEYKSTRHHKEVYYVANPECAILIEGQEYYAEAIYIVETAHIWK